MVRRGTDWERNLDGLRQHARQRAADTGRRAEEAIELFLREQRPITFTALAEAAGVSSAWLYQHMDIKTRIMHLRAQQGPRAKVWMPPSERASDTSKDNVIRTLTDRVKRVEADNRELRQQLEVAYGLLDGEKERSGPPDEAALRHPQEGSRP